MSADNSTLLETVLYGHPPCDGWTKNTEGAFYHLGNTVLFLGYMGGSSTYGCLFIFGFMTPAFTCLALWGWMTMCGVDVFTWNLLLLVACVLQICHLIYRLQQDGLANEELSALYSAVYLPLDVPIQVFKDIVGACENKVLALRVEETYAVEGKTPINQLSFLLSGRIRVSLEGQFLHYIFPHQFLDSPEWESLRPNEEGNFQVTLTAETDCRYISWHRRRLYMLLSKERYITRLFSVMLGSDIANKLYSLNDKLFAKSGVRLDIRLPSLYHVLAPPPPGSEGEVCSGSGSARDQVAPVEQQEAAVVDVDPVPAYQKSEPTTPPTPRLQIQEKSPTPSTATPHQPRGPPSQRQPWPSDMEMPSGGETTGTLPMRYQRGRAPLAPTDTPKL
ncbi:popeye domain-containing 2 isoform X2 [Coregonus clupeaformis]|uniref:POPDC1-3 domain-containing protein n=1 Tax=Coregonus suidteri TaxID=861788 RepID=A0AAN8R6A2_9TELE|nr:popeye domain-containing 2 isoform X2 [Coregonus clupeaformis]